MFDDQSPFQERFEWGEAGILRLAPITDVTIIVDVLSFTTSVDIAVARGATVFPYRWRDDSAAAYAQSLSARLAHPGRLVPNPDAGFSLSPASLQTIPPETRLVLPSPNGSTLTLLAAESCPTVLGGCLRNAAAVATAARALGQSIAVIAAGERWRDAGSLTDSLRPAVEDLVGAGAIMAALNPRNPSPEAIAAIAAYQAALPNLLHFVTTCASGRELLERGFAPDVDLASTLNVSHAVPILTNAAYTAYTP